MSDKLEKSGKRAVGRPSSFDEDRFNMVLDRLATEDIPLDDILVDIGYAAATFWKHMKDYPELVDKYTLARKFQSELMFDRLLKVATSPVATNDMAAVQMKRIEVDTLKWILAKRQPKVYGDKVEHTGTVDANVTHKIDEDQFNKLLTGMLEQVKDVPSLQVKMIEDEFTDFEDA
jgi:hypothetical protein